MQNFKVCRPMNEHVALQRILTVQLAGYSRGEISTPGQNFFANFLINMLLIYVREQYVQM